MKQKLLLCLALVLGGIFYSQPTYAYTIGIQVNRTNIATAAPFIRIVPTRIGPTNNPAVWFRIYLLTNDYAGEKFVSSSVIVADSPASSSCLARTKVQAEEPLKGEDPAAVPKSWAGKYKVFEFFVADRVLANSEFSVGFTKDPILGSAGTDYDFNLKEFAGEK